MTELQTRQASNPEFHWDLTSMFANDEAFEAELKASQTEIDQVKSFEGHLNQSAQKLLAAIEAYLKMERTLSNLYVYGHLKNDQDQADAKYQDLFARVSALYSDAMAASAYLRPELLAMDQITLDQFMAEEPGLAPYQQYLDDLRRFKAHTLSAEIEQILAQGGQFFAGNAQTFSYLNNADLEFPKVTDKDGQEIQITHGNFIKLLESSDRDLRRQIFQSFYKVYDQFRNTFASILGTEIKKNNFEAKIRKFDSARQASLFANNVPESVYDTLVNSVNQRLDLLHRYVKLRRDLLKLQDLEMYDMFTPLLGEPPIKFNYEEAQAIVLEALKPMGEDYLEIVQTAFDEKWIDVYENKGKRSGAYSSGSYDSKPYILMNFQEGIDSLYTLIHEMGHSLHSYLTNQHQDYVYSHYSIFLAEIASTTNENLLTAYLLEKYQDANIQLYILNHFLDGVKSTVYRQTQFAEFEHLMYQEDAAGTPLTAEFLSKEYQAINEKYYGDAVNSDSEIALEWARIPHFYYNYYVFQYSTGFSAATAFAQRILSGDQEARDRYLNFLKSGNKDYPIETMIEAGLDMTQAEYIDATLDVFEERLNEFESLLNSQQ